MNNQKGFIPIILFVIITLLLGTGVYLAATQKPSDITKTNADSTVCTQEAMLCPDGSYVGRTGPNCEFTECPEVNPSPTPTPNPIPTIIPQPSQGNCPPGTVQVGQTQSIPPSPICELKPSGYEGEYKMTLTEGQQEGPLLVQKIYPNYITGLNYQSYPVAVTSRPITLYIGETASNGCDVHLTLISIKGNTATFIKKIDFNKNCPICLAENTLIDTPNGQIPVQELKIGMTVWTIDEFGSKISSVIIKTSKTPVPSTHKMVHIVLDDGREVFASPGHPIGDGRTFGGLSTGDLLGGGEIMTAEKITYEKNYTYDILSSGDTGLYWANGILIGSTLK